MFFREALHLKLPVDASHALTLVKMIPLVAIIRLAILKVVTTVAMRNGFPYRKAKKISESFFYLLQYSLLFAGSTYIMKQENLAYYDFERFYSLYPRPMYFQPSFNLFFAAELSVYIVSTVFLFLETRKENSDFKIMCGHHMVTIMLVLCSYIRHHYYYGLEVANLHDISDIFLEGSKLINYIIGEGPSFVSFAVFAVVFFVTRLIIFPTTLVIPNLTFKCERMRQELGDNRLCIESIVERYVFTAAMTMLLVTNIYWMTMILRMAVGISRQTVHSDVREREDDSLKSHVAVK